MGEEGQGRGRTGERKDRGEEGQGDVGQGDEGQGRCRTGEMKDRGDVGQGR